jgi:hypothetical protein
MDTEEAAILSQEEPTVAKSRCDSLPGGNAIEVAFIQDGKLKTGDFPPVFGFKPRLIATAQLMSNCS